MHANDDRDNHIRWAHRSGASLRDLAGALGLSASRIHQIVHATERPNFARRPVDEEPHLPSWLRKLSARAAKG